MALQLTSTPERGGGERFASGLTRGAARARLFAHGGLGDDGGYGAAWDESILARRVGEVRRRLKLDGIAFPRRVVIIMADLPDIHVTTPRRVSRKGEALPTWPSV